jgi:tetratricopeptide (TPR) repeat protein/transglutaminase-like putative cysteine protease
LPNARPFVLTIAATLILAIAAPSAGAGADSSQRPRTASSLRHQLSTTPVPLAYVTLRSIWSEWDRRDPAEVEEVLRDVSGDGREPPQIRTYAGLLEGYARRRRGDLAGAKRRIARLGYLGNWAIIGPFDNDGKVGMDTVFGPETDLARPIDPSREYDGKDHRPVRWRVLPPASPYGWVDFGAYVRPAEQACVYAQTFVRDSRLVSGESREISVWSGATGALELFWNGVTVLRDDKYRDIDADRFATTVILREGWNRLATKVCGDDRAPMMTIRIARADGAPDEYLQADPDPRHSAEVPIATTSGTAPRVPGLHLEGPLQAFERLSARNDPVVLEAFARYLETTGADDPTEHRARELARRAADAAPTIGRLLLAGELAENRNQKASWIDKADALAVKHKLSDPERIDLMLAHGAYVRTGVNWRDALAIYERVLALDPDNVTAVLAKVDLYEEVGLRETSLTYLLAALARSPHSVALLRAATALLRDDGREAESDEMAERYVALRFDDPAFARARIDLAAARGNVAATSHWLDRLLDINPDSASALRTIGETWTRLGDRPRAIGAYRAALELAPDDTDAMRELANAYALNGERDQQLNLLKRVLERMPQAKDVREQVAHLEPAAPRTDELRARPAAEFLTKRSAPAEGQARRSLVDLRVTSVFASGLASRFHQVVFQPLTEAAATASRDYVFTYETDSQMVQVRTARVFRKDGHTDEAVESGPGPTADDESIAMYTSSRTYIIHFPRLEPGDVIEVQYRIEDVAARNTFADYFGEIAYLQGTEPIFRAEYVLVTPKSRTFYFNTPHVPGLRRTVEENGDERTFDFLALDVPGLAPEPLQPPWTETLGHVHVSTFRSWDEMGRWYWGLVKDQFAPDDEVRRRASVLTQGLTSDAAKVRAIYDYVVQKTRYVALEFGIHGYQPYRCSQIFARGFGDCKDKATLIVTMLGALGIHAIPVIVRTGNRGDIESSPASLAPFDHMIAYVPSLAVYLDGTAEYTGMLELPAMDRGALALQVDEGTATLVRLPDPAASKSATVLHLDATLADDGSAQVDWRVDVSGVEAAEWRIRFHAEATRSQRVQQLMSANFPGCQVSSVRDAALENIEDDARLVVRARVPQFARTSAGGLVVPVGPKEHMVRDFAQLRTRTSDVRIAAQATRNDTWWIRIPPGLRVQALPSPTHSASPYGSLDVDVRTTGNAIGVTTSLSMTRTRVSASEYPAFRAWCEQVDHSLGLTATVAVR